MERHRLANTDLSVSIIGLGCYGMSGAYGPADDAESIATIHRALDLGVNFLDTSASYGKGHNHRLIGEAIRGRRHDVVIHSKSGSPRDASPDAGRGGGDPRYLRQTCEQSLKNLAIETLGSVYGDPVRLRAGLADGTESLRTRRWRKADSNFWSHLERRCGRGEYLKAGRTQLESPSSGVTAVK
jgi:hypothetical protein